MKAPAIATADADRNVALRKEAGAWLKQLREKTGLSQREFAKELNAGMWTFVSQIETGGRRIPPERYSEWAKALRVEPRGFVRELLAYYEPSTYSILFDEDDNADNDMH